ncbi:MAG TPA: hypothetical protein VGN78_14045 [Solirubrobacteraceae bacterium]|nr:hypothetical protein [Solirubrobacteraceae bacterium]
MAAIFASSVQDSFWTVLLVVVIGAAVVAVFTFVGTGKLYEQIGRGGLSLREDDDGRGGTIGGGPPSAAVAAGERDDEIRQLLNARNERRVRRGEAPVDVEAELKRLTAPAVDIDPALRDEIRQLVVARNERRARAGKEPLDVDAEVERQVRELSG